MDLHRRLDARPSKQPSRLFCSRLRCVTDSADDRRRNDQFHIRHDTHTVHQRDRTLSPGKTSPSCPGIFCDRTALPLKMCRFRSDSSRFVILFWVAQFHGEIHQTPKTSLLFAFEGSETPCFIGFLNMPFPGLRCHLALFFILCVKWSIESCAAERELKSAFLKFSWHSAFNTCCHLLCIASKLNLGFKLTPIVIFNARCLTRLGIGKLVDAIWQK